MTKQHLNITLHALRILRAVALVAFYSAVCSCDTKMAENDQMWIFRLSRGWGSHQPLQRCFLLAAGGVTCGAFSLVVLERRYPKEVQDLYETMRRFCPDPGARGARQVHREPRAWVRQGSAAHRDGLHHLFPKYIPLLEGGRWFFSSSPI